MIILNTLLKALLGALGYSGKKLIFKLSEVALFFRLIKPGAIVFVVRADGKGISGTIQAVTRAYVSHVEWYAGQSCGEKGILHETVSAEADKGKVVVTSLDRFASADYMMIAANILDLTIKEFEILKKRAYSRVGTKYDFPGAASAAFPIIPNSIDIDDCSELVGRIFMSDPVIREIVYPDVDWRTCVPGDIYDACVYTRRKNIEIITFNCEAVRQ